MNNETTVPLPEWAPEILALFPTKKTELTSLEVLEKIQDRVTQSAINNRLERLRDLDLLKRVRDGRWWKYSKA